MKSYLPRIASKAALAGITLLLSNCAKDGVSQMLKDNGDFALVRPARTGLNLGDVHRKTNLQESSIPMTRVLSEKDLQALMTRDQASIALPADSSTRSYEMNAEAAYVGVASAKLTAKDVKTFKVEVTNPVMFDAPFEADLSTYIIPSIQGKYPNVNLQDKYIIRSLIRVDALKYTFYNSKNVKVDIAADTALVKELTKAEAGVGWTVTKDSELEITTPMFIGYRLAKVQRDGGVAGVGALPTGAPPVYSPGKVSAEEYPAGAFPETR